MLLYLLDDQFRRQALLEKWSSLIWTERYTKSGDVTLVLPETTEFRYDLLPGTLLELDGSKEVMRLDTYLLEDGLLKVTGPTLDMAYKNAIFRTSASHEDKHWTTTDIPINVLSTIVLDTVVFNGVWANSSFGIDGLKQVIPNLGADELEYDKFSDHTPKTIAVPYGDLYEAVAQLADTYQIGFTIHLRRYPNSEAYVLLVVFWEGRDLTSQQMVHPYVKFSPALDSLYDVKELRSTASYKNVAYAFAPSNPGGLATSAGVAYADSASANATGLNRRAILVMAEDITTDQVGGDPAKLKALLDQRAKDALANNNYVKMIDGEVVPQKDYTYGVHYGLGDIIELDGGDGISQRARITEYIRTQDQTGERSYPTVSVIE